MKIMQKIMYRSTNGFAEKVDFKTAILQGQAPDKGLYVPDYIPSLPYDTIEGMRHLSYPEIAFTVTSPFLKNDIPPKELRRIVGEAYNFELPLQRVDNRRYLLWQTRGPTLSFKDLAARMLSRVLQFYMRDEDRHMTILTATSGDTGSAVASAFYGLDNISCAVLFPEKEVTGLQRKQMTTLGKNIAAFAVDGKFDDCQAIVKKAFSDPVLSHLNLSSANSISFGRLMPQTIQYFYAYSKVAEDSSEEPVISVPCGNFGHLTAGIMAQRMGLPVHKFIAATNANDEFPRFMETGVYKPIVPSRVCISNAMNVGHPSNLARIFDMFDGQMDERGVVISSPNIEWMRNDVFSVSISDEETRETMRKAYNENGIILDPHGAVAWSGLLRYLNEIEEWQPCVSFETADPAKFQEEVVKTLGVRPEQPPALKALEGKDESFIKIPNDYEEFKEALLSVS